MMLAHWTENWRHQQIPAHQRERGGVVVFHVSLSLEARIIGRDAFRHDRIFDE